MHSHKTVNMPESMAPGEREFEELTRLTNDLLTTQRQLHKQGRELQRLNDEKNLAIGVVAHDLRNPLALIKMQSDLLLEESDGLSQDHRNLLKCINEQGRLMLAIVNDLLDVSAIESGALQIHLETVDVVALSERIVQAQTILSASNSTEIEFTKSCDVLLANIDPNKFQQVLVNLIGNAVKYSPAGSRVVVTLKNQVDDFVVHVQDFGPGIPADAINSLFQPYQTAGVNPGRGEKATGLGLTIVRRIIEKHGGSLDVKSEVGTGSVFTVRMPTGDVTRHASETVGQPDSVVSRVAADQSQGLLRVLIVDDCTGAAKMTSRMLRQICATKTELAHDGASGLDTALTFKPHLVLLDIELPRMNGRQVAMRLRDHFPEPPVICAVSAHARSELDEIASLGCFDSVIAKPMSMDDMHRIVEAARRRSDLSSN